MEGAGARDGADLPRAVGDGSDATVPGRAAHIPFPVQGLSLDPATRCGQVRRQLPCRLASVGCVHPSFARPPLPSRMSHAAHTPLCGPG